MDEIAHFLVSAAAGMLRSRRVCLLLPDATRENLTVIASIGLADEVASAIRVPFGAPIVGEVFMDGQPRAVAPGQASASSDAPRADEAILPAPPFLVLPLTYPEGVVGVLAVSEPFEPGAYSEQILTQAETVAEAAAITMVNLIRQRERNEAHDAIILALAKLAESRDPETGRHLERVQSYCRLLAETLARTESYRRIIDEEFITTLCRSSPLHDIGKVGIPDSILLKPGRLTPEEFAIMQQHTVIGGDTIRTLINRGRRHRFLQMGMEIAYCRHERYDGSGYPWGLIGTEIPLSARIVAVADVYDALTTARVYKPAFPHEEAVGVLQKAHGTHLDPDIVDAFLSRVDEFRQMAADLADTEAATQVDASGTSGAIPSLPMG